MIRHPLRFLLIILACTTLAACGFQFPSASPTPTPIPEATPIPKPTYVVQRGEVVSQVEFQGQVAPEREQLLFFNTTGTVIELLVEPGTAVTAGQVLVTLDASAAEQELAAARSELEVLERDAARALRQAELSLQIAQLTLDLYRRQTRSSLEIQIQELEVELAQLALDEVHNDSSLQSRRNQVAALEVAVANAQLVSPVDGRVIEILVVPGRVVKPDTPVLGLGDPDALEVRAQVPDDVLKALQKAMPVVVTHGDAAPLSGSIRILPAPYGHATDGIVRVSLDGPPAPAAAGIRLNDLVAVTALVERRQDVLWLPPQAVNDIAGRTFVIVREGDAQRRADVKLGLVTRERVEIVAGLAEGQVVLGP